MHAAVIPTFPRYVRIGLVVFAAVFAFSPALANADQSEPTPPKQFHVVTSQSHGNRARVGAEVRDPAVVVSGKRPGASEPLRTGAPPPGAAPSSVRPWKLPFAYPSGPSTGGVDPGVVAEVATRVAAGVEVPGARFVMQPDPGRNEWNGLPVGFPVWLHVEHPAPIRVQASDSGVVVDLRAYPVAAVFDTGEWAALSVCGDDGS